MRFIDDYICQVSATAVRHIRFAQRSLIGQSPRRIRVSAAVAAELTGHPAVDLPEYFGDGRTSVPIKESDVSDPRMPFLIISMVKESDPPIFYIGEC